MHSFLQDIRYGLRMLCKSPAFTSVAIITLALGMGANTIVFSILNAMYLRTAPVRNSNELVMSVGRHRGISLSEYQYYRDHNSSFTASAAEYPTAHTYLQGADDSEIVLSSIVSANYFDLLGVTPFLGRFFVPAEEQAEGLQVVVLSYSLWQNRFGGNRDLVGKTVKLNGVSATVIGITPPDFHRLFSGIDNDLWLVSGAAAVVIPHCNPLGYKCDFFASMIGRLKRGKDVGSAQAELNGLNQQWETIYPDLEKNSLTLYRARGIDPRNRLEIAHLPSMLAAAVIVLLLIVCANLSGLLLARDTVRSKEIAIRLALGAGRGRIIRQLLTETAMLGILGTACGALLLVWASGWLSKFPFVSTEGFRSFYNIDFDSHVLLATFSLSIITVFVFGLMPAVHTSSPAPMEAMKQAGSGGRERSRSREILVTGQVALAAVLATGAVLVVRSLNHVLLGPGFDPSHIAIVRVSPYRLGYAPAKSAKIQTEALRLISSLPGVEAVTFGQLMPWWESWEESITLPGQGGSGPETNTYIHYNSIAPNYFRTLNIPLLRGREFTDFDREETPNVVVVNASLAERIWPSRDPIGETLVIGSTSCIVVGVAQDAQYEPAADGVHLFFYRPYWQIQNNGDSRFLVRTESDPGAMLHDIKRTIRNIDPNVPIGEDATMTQALLSDFGSLRLTRAILVFAGVTALTLSAVGLYGLVAFLVAKRNHEIGIRLALGATPQGVLRLFIQHGMKMTVAGAVAGAVLALFGLRMLSTLLYGIAAADPLTVVSVCLFLVSVCTLASYIPARRATKVDPMVVLRHE